MPRSPEYVLYSEILSDADKQRIHDEVDSWPDHDFFRFKEVRKAKNAIAIGLSL